MTMPSSMKSIDASATFRIPVGAFNGSFRPASTKISTVATTAMTQIKAILLKLGKKSGHTRMWLISGKFKARTCTRVLTSTRA